MTTQLKSQKVNVSSNPLISQIRIVYSKRDGRVGFITNATDSKITLKLEGIDNPMVFDINIFLNGFTFGFNREDVIRAVYTIKSTRGIAPRLNNLEDVYNASIYVNDYLERYFDDISNHYIFHVLEKMYNVFQSEKVGV